MKISSVKHNYTIHITTAFEQTGDALNLGLLEQSEILGLRETFQKWLFLAEQFRGYLFYAKTSILKNSSLLQNLSIRGFYRNSSYKSTVLESRTLLSKCSTKNFDE